MRYQLSLVALCVHEAPESTDVYMKPPYTTAASFVPVESEAMAFQLREPALVSAVEVQTTFRGVGWLVGVAVGLSE